MRIGPLTRSDAARCITSLSSFPLLTGYRGAPAADLEAIEDVLLRTSALVDAHAEIAELDLNPVIAGPDGAVAVDARIRVEVPASRPPWPSALRRRGA